MFDTQLQSNKMKNIEKNHKGNHKFHMLCDNGVHKIKHK